MLPLAYLIALLPAFLDSASAVSFAGTAASGLWARESSSANLGCAPFAALLPTVTSSTATREVVGVHCTTTCTNGGYQYSATTAGGDQCICSNVLDSTQLVQPDENGDCPSGDLIVMSTGRTVSATPSGISSSTDTTSPSSTPSDSASASSTDATSTSSVDATSTSIDSSMPTAFSSTTSPSSTTSSETPTSTLPAPTPSYTPLGCFSEPVPHDQAKRAIANFTSGRLLDQSVEQCISICANFGYPLAAVEYGTQCFCSDGIYNGGFPVADPDCTTPCSGNVTETCGGTWLFNLYADVNFIDQFFAKFPQAAFHAEKRTFGRYARAILPGL